MSGLSFVLYSGLRRPYRLVHGVAAGRDLTIRDADNVTSREHIREIAGNEATNRHSYIIRRYQSKRVHHRPAPATYFENLEARLSAL